MSCRASRQAGRVSVGVLCAQSSHVRCGARHTRHDRSVARARVTVKSTHANLWIVPPHIQFVFPKESSYMLRARCVQIEYSIMLACNYFMCALRCAAPRVLSTGRSHDVKVKRRNMRGVFCLSSLSHLLPTFVPFLSAARRVVSAV